MIERLHEKIIEAVLIRNEAELRGLLEAATLSGELNVGSLDEALYAAVGEGDTRQGVAIIKLLLEHGANPNVLISEGNTAMTLCLKESIGIECLEALLTHGTIKGDPNLPSPSGRLPLQYAWDEQSIVMLIRHGADVTRENAHGIAVLDGFPTSSERLKHAVTYGALNPLLHEGKIDSHALVDEHDTPTKAMELMSKYHVPEVLADPSTYQDGTEGLLRVYRHLPRAMRHDIDFSTYHEQKLDASEDQTHIGRYERKKTTRRKNPLMNPQDRPLAAQLITAIRSGEPVRVRHLLGTANANGEGAQSTEPLPLHTALSCPRVPMRERAEIVKSLLEAGADPMLCERLSGCNALTLAAEHQINSQCLIKLIFDSSRCPVDPNQPDNNDCLPLSVCVWDEVAMRLLISHGANVLQPCASGGNVLDDYLIGAPHLLPAATWEGIVRPLLNDEKLDLRILIDAHGEPTPTLQLLQKYHMPVELADPALYPNGMHDLAILYDYMPLSLKHHVDLSAYRNNALAQDEDVTHVGRYERKKLPAKQERQ